MAATMAAEWIEEDRRFWEQQLNSLARYLEQTQTQQSKKGKKDGGSKRDG